MDTPAISSSVQSVASCATTLSSSSSSSSSSSDTIPSNTEKPTEPLMDTKPEPIGRDVDPRNSLTCQDEGMSNYQVVSLACQLSCVLGMCVLTVLNIILVVILYRK